MLGVSLVTYNPMSLAVHEDNENLLTVSTDIRTLTTITTDTNNHNNVKCNYLVQFTMSHFFPLTYAHHKNNR